MLTPRGWWFLLIVLALLVLAMLSRQLLALLGLPVHYRQDQVTLSLLALTLSLSISL